MTLRGIFPALLLAGITAAAIPPSAGAAEEVRGVTVKQQEFKVLDEKCAVCHNRERIDSAVKARQNMDIILRQMGKKGLVLTDRERQMLGHFWQKDPLKKKP